MDKGKLRNAQLTDLSKAFECILHDFFIATVEDTVSHTKPVKLCTISDRKQRNKVNDEFSDLIELQLVFSQGSILSPLLFNIYICDLLFFVEEDLMLLAMLMK